MREIRRCCGGKYRYSGNNSHCDNLQVTLLLLLSVQFEEKDRAQFVVTGKVAQQLKLNVKRNAIT